MVANKRKRLSKRNKMRKRDKARRKRKVHHTWDPVKDPLPKEIITEWEKARIAEAVRSRLGIPRPMISTEFRGKRYVAVGNRMYWGEWKTFMEFLFEYATSMMGREWGVEELRKSFAEMHPLI
jgi:hypothetical protein